MTDDEPDACGPMRISNEYGQTVVEKVVTGKGERLRIAAPGLGHEILLDPLQLEGLTWQDSDLFSTFLTEPYGPDPDPDSDSDPDADPDAEA